MAEITKVDKAEASLSVEAIVRKHRRTILELARQHGAHKVRVFGSAATGQTTPQSDLDLLVELEPGRSLLDRIALIQDLEDALSIPVDVVTKKALHPLIRSAILAQARPL
jgi:uncharacterized protein